MIKNILGGIAIGLSIEAIISTIKGVKEKKNARKEAEDCDQDGCTKPYYMKFPDDLNEIQYHEFTDEEIESIKRYCYNPVVNRDAINYQGKEEYDVEKAFKEGTMSHSEDDLDSQLYSRKELDAILDTYIEDEHPEEDPSEEYDEDEEDEYIQEKFYDPLDDLYDDNISQTEADALKDEELEEDYEQYLKPKNQGAKNTQKYPFEISEEDFYTPEHDGYDKHQLEYYSNKIMVDDVGDVINSVNSLVGFSNINKLVKGFAMDKTRVIFVRNEQLKTDFEITYLEEPWTDE